MPWRTLQHFLTKVTSDLDRFLIILLELLDNKMAPLIQTAAGPQYSGDVQITTVQMDVW